MYGKKRGFVMFKKILKVIVNHIADNFFLYFISVISLCSGGFLGFASGNDFSDSEFLTGFFGGLSDFSADGLVLEGVARAGITALIILVFGLSPAGIVFIPLCDAYKGFAFGFSASAVYAVYGVRSVLFVLLGLIPSAVIWVPALTFASVNGMKTSISLVRIFRKSGSFDAREDAVRLIISSLTAFFALLLSKLAEVYIIPHMLNVVCGLYT